MCTCAELHGPNHDAAPKLQNSFGSCRCFVVDPSRKLPGNASPPPPCWAARIVASSPPGAGLVSRGRRQHRCTILCVWRPPGPCATHPDRLPPGQTFGVAGEGGDAVGEPAGQLCRCSGLPAFFERCRPAPLSLGTERKNGCRVLFLNLEPARVLALLEWPLMMKKVKCCGHNGEDSIAS